MKEALSKLNPAEMSGCVGAFEMGCSIQIPGYANSLSPELFIVETAFKQNYVMMDGDEFSVALDMAIDDNLRREGLYRELLRHCQVLRKEAGLNVDERILLAIWSEADEINTVTANYREEFAAETLADAIELRLENSMQEKVIEISGFSVILQLCKVNER